MSKTDLGTLKPWLGRTDTKDDILTPGLIERFRATLGTHLSDRAGAALIMLPAAETVGFIGRGGAPLGVLGGDGGEGRLRDR